MRKRNIAVSYHKTLFPAILREKDEDGGLTTQGATGAVVLYRPSVIWHIPHKRAKESLMSAVTVPEHSRPLLEAISAGRSFELDSHIFVAQDDWLMAIGYPLEGEFSVHRFESALDKAI